MNDRQVRQLDTLQSAQAFLQMNGAHVPGVAASGMARDLDAAIALLEWHAGNQASRNLVGQGITQRVAMLRETLLRDHMAHIAGLAKAKLPRTPELVALRMPGERIGDGALVSRATAMRAVAAPFSEVFVGAGLPADFLVQFSAAVDSLVASRELARQTMGQRAGATKGIQEAVREGRRVLRALNAFMETALNDDTTLLASWKAVIRVRKSTAPKGEVRRER